MQECKQTTILLHFKLFFLQTVGLGILTNVIFHFFSQKVTLLNIRLLPSNLIPLLHLYSVKYKEHILKYICLGLALYLNVFENKSMLLCQIF